MVNNNKPFPLPIITLSIIILLIMSVHTKCRTTYAGGVERFPVPDALVPWDAEFEGYAPVDFTHPVVAGGPVWADPEIRGSDVDLVFNQVDGNVNRVSFEGEYAVVDGLPLNPKGRTGMVGRGLLGKWGPNHAADPVVTRWKRDEEGNVVQRDGQGVLEFVAIKRNDNGQWAIPGGMVDAGDTVSLTMKKEFGEEALNSLEKSDEEKAQLEEQLNNLFTHGVTIYSGYCDDPRNTDNAWMETVAMNFHDETGEIFGDFPLEAGDDAGAVTWMEISSSLDLYASHTDFIRKVIELRQAAN
eukprot:TRINITY_DN9600_c0_g1_i1.p1 TRINITY_DN9600_c0_g1~~TRINITY_DN9600_c0_g1_i1.p1  ORF type:complete len:299 (+),score=78.52 TRINITY_DN9600_c0_g1_i1:1256-2152(+)